RREHGRLVRRRQDAVVPVPLRRRLRRHRAAGRGPVELPGAGRARHRDPRCLGSFWIAYGVLWLLVVTGNLTLPLPGQAFPALAFWCIGLAAITWSGALASLAESVAIFGVLSTLATASTIAAVSLFVGDESWVKVAGWVF